MTTMNDATKMAVALARKGASDEVIALVMETMATHREHIDAARSAAMTASPAAREMAVGLLSRDPVNRREEDFGARRRAERDDPRLRTQFAMPLLAAIRKQVASSGPVEATAREMCEQHKEEWAQSRAHLRPISKPSARALAGVIAYVIKRHKGVVGGVRFTYLRSEANRSGNPRGGMGSAVYRVEVA